MLNEHIQITKQSYDSYKPVFFRLTNSDDKIAFQKLLASNNIFLFDELYAQLKELIKSRAPAENYSAEKYAELIDKHLDGRSQDEYGAWVYFPWSSKVVHLLDEQEFVELRTSRNKYKIMPEEQALLATKTIGIIGLSVGQSIALTIAMERICGHLRLADFDTADLSNLNRLRTSVANIGIKKTIIAAREIYELDPYLDIRIFNDGITETNIDGFFTENGKIDILVEVCDGLEIKILSRYKARELHIPVVMDTNDRGMLDVERFDLEPTRGILHGLADGLDPQNIGKLAPGERMGFVMKMVDAENLSPRMKNSMKEIGKTISTWPQLASSVTLGGAMTADVCRRILLDQFHDSGRYYVDFDKLVADNAAGIE